MHGVFTTLTLLLWVGGDEQSHAMIFLRMALKHLFESTRDTSTNYLINFFLQNSWLFFFINMVAQGRCAPKRVLKTG